ncbi:MAG TPA: hypothetical protein VH161_06675 [Candidatus Acidoferrales bacterium]|nr:hypothetical protein [Candidatus Acidoferrales bacterium]
MRNRNSLLPLLIFLLMIVAVAWFLRSQYLAQQPQTASRAAPVPAHVGPPDIYPDPVRTPGATNPDITQSNIRETICNPRWSTRSIRPEESYTHRLKIEQISEYGYADSRLRDYEEDHFIPLELGGNPADPKNLWPEPFEASVADGGAHAKDKVENYLHAEVCSGSLTLEQAQREISEDWYRVYQASVPH